MAVGHLQTGFRSVDECSSNHFKRVLAKTPFTHLSAIKNEMLSICIIQLCYHWTLHESHLTLNNYTFWCDRGVPLAINCIHFSQELHLKITVMWLKATCVRWWFTWFQNKCRSVFAAHTHAVSHWRAVMRVSISWTLVRGLDPLNIDDSINYDTIMWFHIKYYQQNWCIIWLLISFEIWSGYDLFCLSWFLVKSYSIMKYANVFYFCCLSFYGALWEFLEKELIILY